MKDKIYAVLTGDVIKSSKLNDADRPLLPKYIQAGYQELITSFDGITKYDVDIFRGDSWQVLLEDESFALKAAIFLRAFFKSGIAGPSFDSRVSVGIGTINMLPSERVSQGSGRAYIFSGKGLDEMKNTNLYFTSDDDITNSYWRLIFRYVDKLISDTSENQSIAVLGALKGLTQNQISENWINGNISQSAVAQHLKAASWELMDETIRKFHTDYQKK